MTSDLALRQELFGRRLSLTLQMRNVLGTARREQSARGPDFTARQWRTSESPMVMLTLRYSLNQFRPERREEQDEGFDEE